MGAGRTRTGMTNSPTTSRISVRGDALLLGRKTFVGFAAAWPGREETEGEFAVRMNSLPKFVVSRSLKEPLEWNGTLLKCDVAEEVGKLTQAPGQDILVYGSGQLLNSLMAHDLIDVYRLMVHPIVLGKGTPLFEQGAALSALKLTDSKATNTGVVMITYEPAD